MKTYATEILFQGTVHIKATSKEQAERILAHNCSNTIYGRDDRWFSNLSPPQRSRASLSTEFTSGGRVVGAMFAEVPRRTVIAAQDRWARNWDGLRWAYDPLSKEYEQVPVYSANVDLTTTVFIRADGVDAAEAALAKFGERDLDFSNESTQLFSRLALDDADGPHLPIALSTALYLLSKSNGSELAQIWPNGPYRGPKFITMADKFF